MRGLSTSHSRPAPLCKGFRLWKCIYPCTGERGLYGAKTSEKHIVIMFTTHLFIFTTHLFIFTTHLFIFIIFVFFSFFSFLYVSIGCLSVVHRLSIGCPSAVHCFFETYKKARVFGLFALFQLCNRFSISFIASSMLSKASSRCSLAAFKFLLKSANCESPAAADIVDIIISAPPA